MRRLGRSSCAEPSCRRRAAPRVERGPETRRRRHRRGTWPGEVRVGPVPRHRDQKGWLALFVGTVERDLEVAEVVASRLGGDRGATAPLEPHLARAGEDQPGPCPGRGDGNRLRALAIDVAHDLVARDDQGVLVEPAEVVARWKRPDRAHLARRDGREEQPVAGGNGHHRRQGCSMHVVDRRGRGVRAGGRRQDNKRQQATHHVAWYL